MLISGSAIHPSVTRIWNSISIRDSRTALTPALTMTSALSITPLTWMQVLTSTISKFIPARASCRYGDLQWPDLCDARYSIVCNTLRSVVNSSSI
jgi:hypothetical protein